MLVCFYRQFFKKIFPSSLAVLCKIHEQHIEQQCKVLLGFEFMPLYYFFSFFWLLQNLKNQNRRKLLPQNVKRRTGTIQILILLHLRKSRQLLRRHVVCYFNAHSVFDRLDFPISRRTCFNSRGQGYKIRVKV